MKVLIVDDEENIRKTTGIALRSMGHEVFEADGPAGALNLLGRQRIDAAIVDLRLDGESGLALLPKLKTEDPELRIVVFTAHASIETAVEAMKAGAIDYIEKPFSPDQLRLLFRRIEKNRKLEERITDLEARLGADSDPVKLESRSPVMQQVIRMVTKAAASEANILILGESGTGKSVMANAVHRGSPRREKRFVTVSCPSLTPELLASELFGHVRGSFTGAVKDHWGKVSSADGGTLFLDEIGDLPIELQPKLLRLLQEKEFERIGETATRRADVRVVAATNRDLETAVREGRFREDLFYRLNVITVSMPPLRERKEDLESLVEGFVRRFARQCGKRVSGFSPKASRWIEAHDWRGNLRELRNFVERAVILGEGEWLELDGAGNGKDGSSADEPRIGEPLTLQRLEEEHIRRVLAKAGTMEEAAGILGIDPATLYRKRKKLGLDANS